MSLPALDNLVRIGQLKAEPRNVIEVTRMLEMARTRLADAQLSRLSLEGRFTSAYLHAPDGTRLIGFDNAHGGIKSEGSRFLHVGKKYPYDHKHRHVTDGGVLYEFDTAYRLVSDFYAEVDRVLKEVSR